MAATPASPTRLRSRWSALLCAVSLLGASHSAFAESAVAPTPTPAIAPAPAIGTPFLSQAAALAERGYVEEEFFLSGMARAFLPVGEMPRNGRLSVAPNPDAVAPYTIRILVRRPANVRRFNGNVVVEWLNVSGGIEIAPDFTFLRDELLREGYAWVGVGTQFIGATALREVAPERYAAIFHPGDSFSYDIYSQAGMALRSRTGSVRPLGPLTSRVRALLSDGESQSAIRLFTYVNAVHPLARVYDGFLIHSTGFGAALSQSFAGGLAGVGPLPPPPPGVPATPDIPVDPLSQIRSDLKEPVMFVNTETELTILGAARSVHLQPDSRSFRMWEMAGTAHADQFLLRNQLGDPDLAPPDPLGCGDPPTNDGPQRFILRASLNALALWVRRQIPPPIAPRLSVDIPPAPGAPSIDRDPATGIAIGGIRLPAVTVPISTETGERPPGAVATNFFCLLFGGSDAWNGDTDAYDGRAGFDPSPTPEPVLAELYQSKTVYVIRVVRAALRSLGRGFLRPADFPEIVRDALEADVP
jgi:hypothetical protein